MSTWEPITRQVTMVSDVDAPQATCTIGGAVACLIERAELEGRPIDEPADMVTQARTTLDQ